MPGKCAPHFFSACPLCHLPWISSPPGSLWRNDPCPATHHNRPCPQPHHIASRPALQLKHFNFSSFGCFIGGSCTAGQSGLRFPGNGGSGTVLTGPPPAATAPPAAPAEPAASTTSFGGPNNLSCCCLARLGTHAEITGTQRATMQPHARQHNLVDLLGHSLDVEP